MCEWQIKEGPRKTRQNQSKPEENNVKPKKTKGKPIKTFENQRNLRKNNQNNIADLLDRICIDLFKSFVFREVVRGEGGGEAAPPSPPGTDGRDGTDGRCFLYNTVTKHVETCIAS